MTTQNTIEENKRIVRAFIETAFNQHQADRAAEFMTPGIKWHGGTLGRQRAPLSAARFRNAISHRTTLWQIVYPRGLPFAGLGRHLGRDRTLL